MGAIKIIKLRTKMPKIFIQAKFFLQYLISILKQWVFIIGFIPWVYNNLLFFFPQFQWPFKFSRLVIYCFLLSAFLIANYRVWANEKQEKEKLIRKLAELKRSSVDFEISYEIKSAQIKIDRIKIVKEIDFIKKGVSEIKKSRSLSTVDFFMNPSVQSCRSYGEAIKNYENKIKRYNEKHKNFYNVHFYIKNVGFVYDENIGVRVSPDETIEFHPDIDLPLEFPQRPRAVFSSMWDSIQLLPTLLPSGSSRYRANINVEKHYFEVDLKDLRVGDQASILYNGVFIELLKNQSRLVFEFEIKSKRLKIPLKKKIVVDLSHLN